MIPNIGDTVEFTYFSEVKTGTVIKVNSARTHVLITYYDSHRLRHALRRLDEVVNITQGQKIEKEYNKNVVAALRSYTTRLNETEPLYPSTLPTIMTVKNVVADLMHILDTGADPFDA